MAAPQKNLKPFEIQVVDDQEVYCDGGAQGHPRVFLHIERHEGQVVCPYCSRTYIYRYKHS